MGAGNGIGVENVIIRDTIRKRAQRLESPETAVQNTSISVNLLEFDDVAYRLQADVNEPTKLTLLMALPPQATTVSLPEGALDAVQAQYGAVVKVVSPTAGFHIALEISLDAIPRGTEAEFDNMVNKLASLRCVVMGAPLRTQLQRLGTGECAEGPLLAVPHRTSEAFFVKPQADSVTIIFPMRFKDANDATIATTFLHEFAEARRAPSLTTAPACSYSKAPPLELKGAPATAQGANGGYVSFVLFQRHVKGGARLEDSSWRMMTFYAFVNYHIKCSKAFMHTRMRSRTQNLLQVLNRAKPDTAKEKKTATGRTFVRN
uniref:Arp2/3 complex 34 kDa subunit n=1 Tax=Pyramimonas obovata TaxID=1411642 RepID=A0A7S0MRY2_9CHLO|mmetsp:Transcript_11996/g.25214  ORF Transcript_11996/g.25214 Transcript_11996/m.25214 type:complete len:318 (+) Transcript_11996:216-1169(+)